MEAIQESEDKTKKAALSKEKDIENNHDIAAFSWTLIFAPILLVLRRDSEFIRFHSKQALLLFFIAIIIFSLPYPFSNLNLLTLAVAVTGFLNANLGRWWKVPLLYDLVEAGVTPGGIATFLRKIVFGTINLVKRIFTKGPGFAIKGTFDAVAKARGIDIVTVNKKVEKLEKEKFDLFVKTDFLERELLIEKYLQGELLVNLDENAQSQINQIEKILKSSKKITFLNLENYFSFKLNDKEILLGNFDQKGALLFLNFDNKKADIEFGKWQGIAILFDDKNTFKQLEKLSKEFVGN